MGGETVGFDMPKTVELIQWVHDLLPKDKPRYSMVLECHHKICSMWVYEGLICSIVSLQLEMRDMVRLLWRIEAAPKLAYF